MLLTALVQYSRGTLILNLPRDRYDLALKLDSIGITKKFWDKLRIADDEDNEFSVKLFGENDIGKHLSLIFTENDTIFDVNNYTKETETLKRKMSDLASEIANALIGESKFTEEALSLAIDTAKAKIENNVSLIEEKRYQLNHKEDDIRKLDYYFQQFVSWADEFDNASAERKRMILCTLFKEITIGRGYKIELLMDNSYEQFIA